jgi:hypothetical protein
MKDDIVIDLRAPGSNRRKVGLLLVALAAVVTLVSAPRNENSFLVINFNQNSFAYEV